jgi:hypothetical protein
LKTLLPTTAPQEIDPLPEISHPHSAAPFKADKKEGVVKTTPSFEAEA